MTDEETEAARLSKLLFTARELIDMYADMMVSSQPQLQAHVYPRAIRDEIDEYRAEKGWSPNGFGGET